MDDKKRKELAALVGDKVTETILGHAEATQKEADTQGVTFKELEPAATGAKEEPTEEESRKVGDLSMAELKNYIGECMAAYGAAKSTKEAGALTEFKESVVGTINKAIDAVNEQGKRLKALEGSQPRSVKNGYLASHAEETVTEKAAGPQADPTFAVIDQMLGIPLQQAQVNGTPPVPAK